MAIDSATFRTGYLAQLGMRGTSTWSANENPESWREAILYLYPNGKAPLTALLSKLKNVKENNTHFHWFMKKAVSGSGVATDVYSDELVTAYVSGAVKGSEVWVGITAAYAARLRTGVLVMIRQITRQAYDTVGRVVSVQRGSGTTSFIKIKLLEDDNGSLATATPTVMMIGNSNPEGSGHPEAVQTVPTEAEQYMQIWRNTLSLTRTALQTKLRTPDQYAAAKRECLEDHSMAMEMSLYYSIMGYGVGINGQPERTTGGIRNLIKLYAPDNIVDVARTATLSTSGDKWEQYGKTAMDAMIRQSFLWGASQEKLVLCGDGALAGIQQMVEANAQYTITRGEAAYGIKISQLVTPFGTWNLLKAPLMTLETSETNNMLVLEPADMQFRYLQDTIFLPDVTMGKGGIAALDGKIEGYLTEGGLAIDFPEKFMVINNVGVDSLL
jgi:hypothetical protein